MKIHHLRNATFIIESGETFILVDPMLGSAGSLMPLAFVRFKPRFNPIVPLPENATAILEKVTHCLITHCQRKHEDHLDSAGKKFLRKKYIPTVCSTIDERYLIKRGLNIEAVLSPWKKQEFLGGNIIAIPAIHGYGWIHHLMADGVGFYIELPNEPSIYISGDTVYTQDVDRALKELQPDIAVVAAGSAQLDIGQPILMTMDDILKFIRNAPGKVMANHLEALNHCPTTRNELKKALESEGLSDKVFIPFDGNVAVNFN